MAKKSRRKPPARKSKRPPPRTLRSDLDRLLTAANPDRNAEFDLDSDIQEVVFEERIAGGYDNGFQKLSLSKRRYLACFNLEMEVNNGGFMQFFDNQGSAVAKEALAFLDDRGPAKVATLLRRAIEAFPGGRLPRSLEKLRDLTLADYTEDGEPGPLGTALDKITSKFFDGQWGPTLIRNRLKYVRDHATEFFA